ncbi:MAG TPA: DUF3108 domain-containing protein [Thermoanaerobaculia bacterium]|nr:DUF3108 domain-containing protein [Thermoanaerobaculia bacterium]
MKKLFLALSLIGSPLAAQEKPEPPPFLGEKLLFAMSILGVAGGDLTLSAAAAELGGKPVYKFEMGVVSNNFLSKFYVVRDTIVSWVEPGSFRSLRYEKHAVEGKRVRDELTEFDYEKGVAIQDGKPTPLGEASLDTLSSVYYLRTLALEADKPPSLRVFSGKPHVLTVEIQGKEFVEVPAGKFRTIRVEPKSAGSSLVGKNLVLWLTDDAKRIPVQLRSKLNVGTLVGKLKSIETK